MLPAEVKISDSVGPPLFFNDLEIAAYGGLGYAQALSDLRLRVALDMELRHFLAAGCQLGPFTGFFDQGDLLVQTIWANRFPKASSSSTATCR